MYQSYKTPTIPYPCDKHVQKQDYEKKSIRSCSKKKKKAKQQRGIYVVEYMQCCDKMKVPDAEPSISDPGRLSKSNTCTHMHMGHHVTNRPKL